MLKPLIKIGSIVAFFAALGLFLWWNMRIPPPREQERVRHRDGIYSIVKPRGWEHEVNYSPRDSRLKDSIEIRFPTERARDRRIFVGRWRQPPDIEQIRARDRFLSDEFQGRPAQVFEGRTRLEYYWRAVFQHGSEWYELVLWLPLPEDVPQSGWWAYLQSFEATETPQEPSTFPATTQPFSISPTD